MNDSVAPQERSGQQRTLLYDLHVELGGRIVDFAGWELPIHYSGVIAEHVQTRTAAGLFDVSHMGVVEIRGDNPGISLERVTPAGGITLAIGRQRYGLLTTDEGGIIDDFMVANWRDHLTMVSNASRADVDIPHLIERLSDCDVEVKPEVSLLASQGPAVAEVIGRLAPALTDTVFLDVRLADVGGIQVAASRCGYTGEDGLSSQSPTTTRPPSLGSCSINPKWHQQVLELETPSASKPAFTCTATTWTSRSHRWKRTSAGASRSGAEKPSTSPVRNDSPAKKLRGRGGSVLVCSLTANVRSGTTHRCEPPTGPLQAKSLLGAAAPPSNIQ